MTRFAAAVLACALALTACTTRQVAESVSTARGGVLHLLTGQTVDAWDPQRMAASPEGAFATRVFLRTLTTQAPAGIGFSPGLVGDLASTTGHSNDGGRTWQFSLVSDARWQDNRFVTCEDLRYGISRNFAREVVGDLGSVQAPGGYARQLLDIPTVTDGGGHVVSAYQGPYSGVGQALFDKAVTCTGQLVTFHLNSARADFDEIVSLPQFGPYRKDMDPLLTHVNAASAFWVFSCGPYMLEGLWDPAEGGRFVRNRNWRPLQDPIRAAYPDVIEVDQSQPATAAIQRVVDDQDSNAVTWSSAPPAMFPQMGTSPLSGRVTNPDAPEVDVLVPNPDSPVMSNPAVRQAFAMTTDRDAYAQAYGGSMGMTPTDSVISRNLPGHSSQLEQRPSGALAGDPAAAAAALAAAGVPTPVRVTVAQPGSAVAMSALQALQASWSQAGFAVTVVAGGPAAPSVGAARASRADIVWGSVAANYPGAGAVLPDVLAGSDDPAVTSAVVDVLAEPSPDARAKRWAQLDREWVAAGRYLPLGQHRHVLVHGSGIVGYQDNVLQGGFVDVAAIEVLH